MTNIITYTSKFNLSIKEAYNITLKWLEENKAKIKKSDPPTYIEAAHGKRFGINRYDPRFIKDISISFDRFREEVTHVRIKTSPNKAAPAKQKKIHDRWWEGLFSYLFYELNKAGAQKAGTIESYTYTPSEKKEEKKGEGILVFVSYATKDADLYKISELARALESYKEIGEVLYWQEDMHDSIIEYMNDNLGKCDVVLLFCSPHALESVPVKKEWMAAEAIQKPIIPVFLKPEHIPTLLRDRLGFEFDTFDFQKNVQKIYELILKKKEN